ncbi:carboxypeptidase-like regulatory domain-containing protein [Mucilaginibacter sp. L196]|uniref:carboxypeptidase-like regulatory domain-containing protein n=1 Tax=Mucilaginibacter sp. L196 TaxID=1641870 RepID=UPI001C20A1B2|nr:carboxypeptidase-like regulatory domain-containing protein [Mucilaginibacter sp. L196]
MIKNLLLTISLLLFISTAAFAQQLNGVVLDKLSHRPVEFATIRTGQFVTSTSIEGKFSLYNIRFGDTIRVTCVGYVPNTYTVYNVHADTIYVEPVLIQLQDVNVRTRNYKTDSLNLRKEFAGTFNYQKPALKDFLKNNLPTYTTDDHGSAYNDNSSIGGLNLLSIVSLFGRNKTPSAKLQKQLQDDEESNYVDHKFSKSKVEVITHMQGDSLQDFMDSYRPTITRLKQMTDYELLIYIKDSYTEFIKTYKPGEREVFKKP